MCSSADPVPAVCLMQLALGSGEGQLALQGQGVARCDRPHAACVPRPLLGTNLRSLLLVLQSYIAGLLSDEPSLLVSTFVGDGRGCWEGRGRMGRAKGGAVHAA